VLQDSACQEVAELLLYEGGQRHAVRLPPGRLQEGDEVLADTRYSTACSASRGR
jgi:hypothetical protein